MWSTEAPVHTVLLSVRQRGKGREEKEMAYTDSISKSSSS